MPVEHIAVLEGAHIRYVSFDSELSGLLFEECGRTIIGVNMAHPMTRQRFTIAHELGHLELKHWREFHIDRRFYAVQRNGKLDLPLQAPNPDQEANAFAVELLMPAALLMEDIQDAIIDYESDNHIIRLAERYKVSLQTMLLRLTSLGLIQSF